MHFFVALMALVSSVAMAGETIRIGSYRIPPGSFVTGYWAFFDYDKAGRALVGLKVNADDVLNGFQSTYRWFRVPGLNLAKNSKGRKVILYGSTLCARKMRVFRNFKNLGCKPVVKLVREDYGWIRADVTVEVKE